MVNDLARLVHEGSLSKKDAARLLARLEDAGGQAPTGHRLALGLLGGLLLLLAAIPTRALLASGVLFDVDLATMAWILSGGLAAAGVATWAAARLKPVVALLLFGAALAAFTWATPTKWASLAVGGLAAILAVHPSSGDVLQGFGASALVLGALADGWSGGLPWSLTWIVASLGTLGALRTYERVLPEVDRFVATVLTVVAATVSSWALAASFTLPWYVWILAAHLVPLGIFLVGWLRNHEGLMLGSVLGLSTTLLLGLLPRLFDFVDRQALRGFPRVGLSFTSLALVPLLTLVVVALAGLYAERRDYVGFEAELIGSAVLGLAVAAGGGYLFATMFPLATTPVGPTIAFVLASLVTFGVGKTRNIDWLMWGSSGGLVVAALLMRRLGTKYPLGGTALSTTGGKASFAIMLLAGLGLGWLAHRSGTR